MSSPPHRPEIELLAAYHRRETFFCGTDPLDRYFRYQATQDMRRDVAAVFVLMTEEREIGGYYTLSATAILPEQFPEEIQKKLPKYKHVPATLLGRLAIARKFQGKHYGDLLLTDALKRCLRQSREIASMAVVVDAKDDNARAFYAHYDFIGLPDVPYRLFLPMKTLRTLFQGSL